MDDDRIGREGKEEKMDTDKIYAEALASEYSPRDTSRIAALRRLDARAKLPATVLAYSLDIVGALVMGAGMCLSMGILAEGPGASVAGVVLGLVGIAAMAANYPIYRRVLARGKSRYAFEIVELAREVAEGER